MNTFKVSIAVFILVFCSFTGVWGQDNPYLLDADDSPFQSDELQWVHAKMVVETATKKKELLQEAPANIAVITQSQIQNLGFSTLVEVLSFVPGITVLETYFGYTDVVFRGNYQEHYNNKSLLLINGHPSWEVVNGSFHLEMIPLNAIKQVEIIRGPGSVLYGTNAYAGVINIITFEGRGWDRTHGSVRGGSFGTAEVQFSTGREVGDLDYFVAGSFQDNKGYDFEMDADEAGNAGSIDYENDVTNLFGSFSYKDIGVDVGYFSQNRQKVGLVPVLTLGGESSFEGGYVDLEFKKRIIDPVTMQINIRYDMIDRLFRVNNLDGGVDLDTDGTKRGGELQITYQPQDTLHFTFGGSVDQYEADPYLFNRISTGEISRFSAFLEDSETDENAVYVQGDWRPWEQWRFIGGVRYNDNSRAGDDLSPNVGGIYEFDDQKYFKILYGEAFRSPNFFEQLVNTQGVLVGDPDIEAEKIKTLDIGLDMALEGNMNLNVNGFFIDAEDSISRGDTNSDGVPDYLNGEGHEIYGLEVELKADLDETLSFFINGSYKTSELKENHEDIPFLENTTANAGLGWKPFGHVLVTPTVQYVGKREDNDSALAVDAYTLVHLNILYRLNDSLRLSLAAHNLFDEEYTYPEYIRQRINDIGGGPGQAFYIKVDWEIL